MITFVRSWVAQPGKVFDLIGLLKEMSALGSPVTGRTATVASTIGGNFSEASLIWEAESLSESDEAFAKLMAVPGFPALIAKLGTLIVPGMSHEHLYRHA
jgi:hypothetical protein